MDKLDTATGLSAMMRTTTFPASIIAQMMARGEVSKRGPRPQELPIAPDKFVAELARRNIQITVIVMMLLRGFTSKNRPHAEYSDSAGPDGSRQVPALP